MAAFDGRDKPLKEFGGEGAVPFGGHQLAPFFRVHRHHFVFGQTLIVVLQRKDNGNFWISGSNIYLTLMFYDFQVIKHKSMIFFDFCRIAEQMCEFDRIYLFLV